MHDFIVANKHKNLFIFYFVLQFNFVIFYMKKFSIVVRSEQKMGRNLSYESFIL